MPSLLSLVPAWTTAAVALQLLTHAAQSAYLPQDFQKPVPEVSERMKGLAMRVSNLAPSQCRRELAQQDKEKVFQKQGPTSGIATPLRIAGPVSGVTFQVPPAKFPYGRLDCRLALVILQMAPVLKSHGIESVRIDSFYRQGARLSGRRSKKSQHAYGLAIDLVSLRGRSANMTEAATLDVKEDFRGKRGETPCGPKARLHLPKAASADDVERAVLLRNVVCALGRSGMFHHILTPNYNQAHESHIHLDIKRDNKWFSLD